MMHNILLYIIILNYTQIPERIEIVNLWIQSVFFFNKSIIIKMYINLILRIMIN